MDQRREKSKGLLERWDERNQRIVERQIRDGRCRDKEWSETHFDITTAHGKQLTVWAQPSGYPFRFADGGADVLALVILPVMWAVASLRHRYQFRRGWSVAVLIKGRAFERIVRLERFPTKDEAKIRAAQIAEEISAERE
ncbi:MAG: hypothetical protein LC808_35700 [Actinobacteria bacterium]|nr:hypothetical protein [Actinomycetota bacterium]